MILYVAVYGIIAHLFFWFMIKPWEDNFIEGAESNIGVAVIGKVVLLANVVIQVLVMLDVMGGKFMHAATVDQMTFIWNTSLLLVTNFYIMRQECFREGVRWTLAPPKDCTGFCWEWHRQLIQSAKIESEIGQNLVSVMVSQIVALYIMGEIGNVLGPAIFNWVALRLVFVANVGGSHESPFQKALLSILPKFNKPGVITAREAERAQILAPLLLWMEYTYIVLFPAMGFLTLFLMTDTTSTVCLSLRAFSVVF
jgi:hypothetical protein